MDLGLGDEPRSLFVATLTKRGMCLGEGKQGLQPSQVLADTGPTSNRTVRVPTSGGIRLHDSSQRQRSNSHNKNNKEIRMARVDRETRVPTY